MGKFDGARGVAALELHDLLAEYCWELDTTGGLESYTFYAEDGYIDIGAMTMRGHAEIKAFYQNLAEMAKAADASGERTTRHVFTNPRISFRDDDNAVVDFLVVNFSSAGKAPILDATTPSVVSDTHWECRRQADGAWRIAAFTGAPIFVGNDPLLNKALVE